MTFFFHLLSRALVLLFLSTPLILVILAIEPQADTTDNVDLSEGQLANIQQLLIDNDPRLLINTDNQAIQLNENELDSLLNYFKSNFPALRNAAISSSIDLGKISFSASIPVQAKPFGNFVNVNVTAIQAGNFISIETIKIGSIHIPVRLSAPLIKLMQNTLQEDGNYQLFTTLLDSIKQTSLQENNLSITLNWQSDNIENIRNQARQIFISSEEIDRMLRYHEQLSAISHSFPADTRNVSLNDFLKPMFTSASINSAAGADPRAENRAIFIVMTAYITELRLEHLIGTFDENIISTPRPLKVVVQSRRDIPRHIVSSAAIASSAGVSVAKILSVYKEVHDSRYRSGFSFSDLTANQVGSLLGKLSDRTTAVQLQSLMSQSQQETDYMPVVTRFDGMTEKEFIARFQDRDSEQYQQRIAEIEKDIAQRPFFQAFELDFDIQ